MKVRCQAVAVRFVADTRTDEFLNIGVVLFCPAKRYAGAKFLSSWARISAAFPTADLVHLRRLKRLFERACEEWTASTGQPALFETVADIQGLLASMVALDDASIQFSPPLSGITADPDVTLAELFRTYVRKDEDEATSTEGRDDAAVWRSLVMLARPEVVRALRVHTLSSAHYKQDFDHSWKNGQWNAAQPLSFDMQSPQSIREKALLWASKIHELRPAENDMTVHFLVGLPGNARPKSVQEAARDAFEILRDSVSHDDARVLPEDGASSLLRKIEQDLEHADAERSGE